jgi:hypothetical protein
MDFLNNNKRLRELQKYKSQGKTVEVTVTFVWISSENSASVLYSRHFGHETSKAVKTHGLWAIQYSKLHGLHRCHLSVLFESGSGPAEKISKNFRRQQNFCYFLNTYFLSSFTSRRINKPKESLQLQVFKKPNFLKFFSLFVGRFLPYLTPLHCVIVYI